MTVQTACKCTICDNVESKRESADWSLYMTEANSVFQIEKYYMGRWHGAYKWFVRHCRCFNVVHYHTGMAYSCLKGEASPSIYADWVNGG